MPPVGKSGPGMISISSSTVTSGLVDEPDEAVADLAQVVRRDLGGHADGDAVGAVDQQVGKLAGQDQRLAVLAVVVVDEIDGVAFQVGQHLGADGGQAGLGVPMGGGRQAGDGAEVALPVDQAMAHGPVLGHVDQRRVDGRVAVRVVALHRLADDAGALAGGGGGAEAQVVHRHQDAPLRRLEAVAHVGQGPADDDAHGVGQVAVLELVLDVQRLVAVAVAAGDSRGLRRNLLGGEVRPARQESSTIQGGMTGVSRPIRSTISDVVMIANYGPSIYPRWPIARTIWLSFGPDPGTMGAAADQCFVPPRYLATPEGMVLPCAVCSAPNRPAADHAPRAGRPITQQIPPPIVKNVGKN